MELAGRQVVLVKKTPDGIVVRLRPKRDRDGLPHYEPETREWRVAEWLRRRGQTPTAAAVAERIRAIDNLHRTDERRHRWREELRTETPVVARFVQRVRAETGAGPTWAEVATEMGWKYQERNWKLHRLIGAGALVTTNEARSLDVPPATEPVAPEPGAPSPSADELGQLGRAKAG